MELTLIDSHNFCHNVKIASDVIADHINVYGKVAVASKWLYICYRVISSCK